MREFLIHIAKMWIKSEIFTYLFRSLIVMPDDFKNWTSQAMSDSIVVGINQLTPFQLCTEAYASRPKAPFALADITVKTHEGSTIVKVPVNTSVKRASMAHAYANELNLQASVRRSVDYRNLIEEKYKNTPVQITYQIVIKTNSPKRLLALTQPVQLHPARTVLEKIRHASLLTTSTSSLYHEYCSIMLQSGLIQKLEKTKDHEI